jgi:methionine-rich copper-binding protein CopC
MKLSNLPLPRTVIAGLLVICLQTFISTTAWSHAVVTASSLANNPVKPGHATTVELVFNSKVELSLSKVFVVNDREEFTQVQIAHGKKPGELYVKIPELSVGSYAIKYKVFAADGHLTESTIRFRVEP